MKLGQISIAILLYFLANIVYALTSTYTGISTYKGITFEIIRWCLYYLTAYSFAFYLLHSIQKNASWSVDIFCIYFAKAYIIFKFVFYCVLIQNDMPTYISWMDSKVISIILSICVLLFTLALFKLTWTKGCFTTQHGHL